MVGLICLGVILGILGIAWFIGWGAGTLFDAYYKYRVKRNHINHPKLVELQEEYERVSKEYRQWWDKRYEAQRCIDINYEILKYCTDEEADKYFSIIEQNRQVYTNADKHMRELSPLVDSTYEAERAYREKHNIRHW